MSRANWVSIAVIAAVLVLNAILPGCASFTPGGAYGDDRSPSMHAPLQMRETQVQIKFVFASAKETAAACTNMIGRPSMACSFCPVYRECTVYAATPNSWNDREALATLGHEVAHTLGANHE